MTWKVSLFLNVGDINIFFIEQHISITAKYKNRPILFDEKLKTDFCTEDNTEQFKLHLQRYITKWTPWWIITLLWSRGLVYLIDPESYASGAWVLAGSPMLDRSKGKGQTKKRSTGSPGWGLGAGLKKSFATGTATEDTKTTGLIGFQSYRKIQCWKPEGNHWQEDGSPEHQIQG